MAGPVVEPSNITTSDGLTLEAELASPPASPHAAAVLCHPHPQYGGTMRSIVIGALFDALPRAGVTCLRFNFRGVEGSEGAHDQGRGELLDARAGVAGLAGHVAADVPLVLVGWSFGADIALATVDDRLAAWLAIAPPLRIVPDFSAVARDPRPKLLVLAEHDEFREPTSVMAETAEWTATDTEVIGGASHFFVGRTDRLVEVAVAYLERVTTRLPPG
ncbi:MAG TPA: alpha/beta hydrolase [Acidimicrobiia bacterium]|nr:alpha/beta hydrolase [Acidimicrobiia bacterium]